MSWYPVQQRYQKANVKQCGLSLNRKTDAGIIEWLEKQPNRAAYLKRIIREDMERSEVERRSQTGPAFNIDNNDLTDLVFKAVRRRRA